MLHPASTAQNGIFFPENRLISMATGKPYPLEFISGADMKLVTLPSRVSVSGAEVYTGAAIAGLGLIQVPRYHVYRQLSDGALRVVLAAYPPPPLPVRVKWPPVTRESGELQ